MQEILDAAMVTAWNKIVELLDFDLGKDKYGARLSLWTADRVFYRAGVSKELKDSARLALFIEQAHELPGLKPPVSHQYLYTCVYLARNPI